MSGAMNFVRASVFVLFAFALSLALTSSASAEDYKLTGSGIRVKTVAFIDFNVYEIRHHMREFPATKSKPAVIEKETGKKFTWTMLRDVDHERIEKALRDAFAMNGYADAPKIDAFVGAFKGELKKGATVTISYDPEKKSVSVTTPGGSARVEGSSFMRAVWSIWFGKIDQPKLGDELISKLPG
jgi:hypothetical protein